MTLVRGFKAQAEKVADQARPDVGPGQAGRPRGIATLGADGRVEGSESASSELCGGCDASHRPGRLRLH